jgi:hypothetical protein
MLKLQFHARNFFLRLEGLLFAAAVVSGLDELSLFHFLQKARTTLAKCSRITWKKSTR